MFVVSLSLYVCVCVCVLDDNQDVAGYFQFLAIFLGAIYIAGAVLVRTWDVSFIFLILFYFAPVDFLLRRFF